MRMLMLLILALFAGYLTGKGLIAADMYPQDWISNDIIIDPRN